MTDLVVRKIRWDFDATVPFLWQPANPNFGMFCNAFTFIAVPFERYLIKALRQAQPDFDRSPAVAAEADAFLRQEGQHAAAHRKHMAALIARYPGLERAYVDATAAFDDLIDGHPVQFHASYIANLEATFTPLFKVILDNRHSLFAGSDPRVAALMTWHFVEEIEHRSSGLILCNHLTPHRWYRARHIRHTFRHIGEIAAAIGRTIDEVVPAEERVVSAEELMSAALLVNEFKFRGPGGRRRRTRLSGPPTLFGSVPSGDLTRMVWRLALSQMPYHDPADQPLPDWAGTWMSEYDNGADMTVFSAE
ncbi:metal-dependent hydrolase [Mycolicibacter heraklionensis]|uniref:Metal-dependent hydrolase n=1 Tax=Mycolicibacter heraklionensis TaxID=512402 RepID=A0A9X7WKD1_9MYCO|nr:metal-dependent hydrolase [Mycolicibacter heraklionensis]QZA09646.1 metal-dependent hydrolase [Mycolicibacter heraklionensis]